MITARQAILDRIEAMGPQARIELRMEVCTQVVDEPAATTMTDKAISSMMATGRLVTDGEVYSTREQAPWL